VSEFYVYLGQGETVPFGLPIKHGLCEGPGEVLGTGVGVGQGPGPWFVPPARALRRPGTESAAVLS
jgi:hypothetical protein